MNKSCSSLREHARNVINLQKNTSKYRAAEHRICNLKFNVPNKNPVVFHNGSNYDYHFIIKELALSVLGKHRKIQNFFHSNRKRSYKS